MRTKRRTSMLLFLLTSLIGLTSLHAEDKERNKFSGTKDQLHVYLLIGQSNMAGRAPFSKSDSTAIKDAYVLNDKDSWVSAQNPLNQYSTIRKSMKMQKMNPGYYFAKTMLKENEGISVGLVVNAKGGTKIREWSKGGQFYNDAIKRAKAAQKTGTLKGILWHQGESDSSRSDLYLKKLTALITDLRKDLNEPTLPFIAGQVFYDPKNKPNTKKINEEIAKLPAALPHTGMAESKGLTTYDYTHFDSAGMKGLGERYAKEMIKVQKAAK